MNFFCSSTTIKSKQHSVSIKFIFPFHRRKKNVDVTKNYLQLHVDNRSPCIPFLSNLVLPPSTRSLGLKLCEPSCRGEAVYHIYKRRVKIITSCHTNRKILTQTSMNYCFLEFQLSPFLSYSPATSLIPASATDVTSILTLKKTKIFENESPCLPLFFL